MTRQNSLFEKNDFNYLSLALDSIKELFAFETNGRIKYQPEDIAITTLLMCAFNTSAETVQMIEGLPSADRILERLGEGKALEMGERINHLLKKRLMTARFHGKGKVTVACDITEKPFYGDREEPHAMGGKPRDGTYYFIKYLTFSLVVKGHRFPTGFYPLTKERLQWVPEMIEKEITWLQENVSCDRIILDRGFNDFDNYNKIDNTGCGFIMPLKKNNRVKKAFSDCKPSLTKRQRKKGFVLDNYHPEEWNDGIRVLFARIKTGEKRGGQWVFYVTNMDISPMTALFIYKSRWGIETAYSQVHTLEAFTKSRKHAVRVFLTGLAFLLLSAWVYLNWELASRSKSQRNKNGKEHATVNRKRFETSITLPCFRMSLLLALLVTISEKSGNRNPLIKQKKS